MTGATKPDEFHPHQVVRIKEGVTHPQVSDFAGSEYHIEGLWNEVTGGSWMDATGNPAALVYAIRSAMNGLPADDNVYYGKVGHFGHLVHVSEMEAIPEAT